MKKKLLRTVALGLILVALLGTVAFASVQANPYISATAVVVDNPGKGVIDVAFTINGTGTMKDIGALRVDLYNKDGSWYDKHEYTDKGYGYMMTTDDYSHGGIVSFDCEKGNTYYAVVNYYAGDLNGSGGGTMMKSSLIKAK